MYCRIDQLKFKSMNRRELLKLTPVVRWAHLRFHRSRNHCYELDSDSATGSLKVMFRSGHFATTFSDSDLTPFEKFPINDYDVDDPGVDFDRWTLTVAGAVQKAGDHKLEQILALPKFRQNIRHVCVEGWDAIGSFGGARLSDFLKAIGADLTARYVHVECR